MVAQAKYVPGDNRDPLVQRVAALEKALAAVANKTLYSANIGTGGLTVNGTGGVKVGSGGTGGLGNFYTGGGSTAPQHADGSPQVISAFGDENGQDRLVLWDSETPSSPARQRWYEWDVAGRLTRSQDINGGWATPWFGVPLYPRFTPPQNSPDTSGSVYGYATISTSTPGIAQGQELWEGRIPFVSHPQIAIDGTWGPASGSVVPTYSLNVNGSSVGTWTPGYGPAAFGPWNIASLLTFTQIPVTITVTWTGSGLIAADVLGCYLRQT